MLSLETIFRDKLLDQYQNAPLDVASFHRLYKACGPGECLGMCCNGGSGFYLDEEADTIRTLVSKNTAFFEKQGLPMPENIFDEELDEETGKMELSTQVRPTTYPSGLKPSHFPDTACIFRRGDGACSLQLLGLEQGKPGWWYKPVACWLFPIELEWDGKPHIRVAHATTDEYVDETYPGFVGYTKCGSECPSMGKPAYLVLEHEIKELSRWLGRDLLGEIMAYEAKSA
jgi:hypothetical protein